MNQPTQDSNIPINDTSHMSRLDHTCTGTSSYDLLNSSTNTNILLQQSLTCSDNKNDPLNQLQQRTETLEHMQLLQSTDNTIKNQFIREYIINQTERDAELYKLTEQIKVENELQQQQLKLKHDAEMKYLQSQLESIKSTSTTQQALPNASTQQQQQSSSINTQQSHSMYNLPMSSALMSALQQVHSINTIHSTLQSPAQYPYPYPYPYHTAVIDTAETLYPSDTDNESKTDQNADENKNVPKTVSNEQSSELHKSAQTHHSKFNKLLHKFEHRVNHKNSMKQKQNNNSQQISNQPNSNINNNGPSHVDSPQLSFDSELRAELLLWKHYYTKLKRKYNKLKLRLDEYNHQQNNHDNVVQLMRDEIIQLKQQLSDVRNDKLQQRHVYDNVINNIDMGNMWYTDAQKKRLDMFLNK